MYLANAKIHRYLNAPLISPFGTLKEEVVKFIVSHYHRGKFWLPEPINITLELIYLITGLPTNGYLVLISRKNPTLLEELIRYKARKTPRE